MQKLLATLLVVLSEIRGCFMGKAEWFIVIKYTQKDFLGECVDAHFVVNSPDAMYCVACGPMKPGEMLRGFWVQNEDQRMKALQLHEHRRKLNRDWQLFMEHVDDCWMRAQHGGVFRDS